MIASADPEILYWHVARTPDGKLHGQARRAALNVGLADGVLFRVILTPSRNLEMQKSVAERFAQIAPDQAANVVEYLEAFFRRIMECCQIDTPNLSVRKEAEGCELDFPRSSASWMMMREFCLHLNTNRTLAESLRSYLARWR